MSPDPGERVEKASAEERALTLPRPARAFRRRPVLDQSKAVAVRTTLSRVITRLRATADNLIRSADADGPAVDNRLVVVWGNCQAHYLAAILAAQGVGMVCVAGQPFGFVPEHRGVRPFILDIAEITALIRDARAAGRKVIYLEQIGPMSPGVSDALRALADGRVLFPHIDLQALWLADQPHSQARQSPDQIRRRLDLDLAAIRRAFKRAEWEADLADWIAASLSSDRLFHTFNHPRGEIMARLHGEICRRLAAFGALSPVGIDQAQADILAEDGLAFISHLPVSDAVVEALDLRWAREGWYALTRQAWAATLKGDHYASLAAFAAVHRAYPANAEYARQWIEGLRNQKGVPLPVEPELFTRYPNYERPPEPET